MSRLSPQTAAARCACPVCSGPLSAERSLIAPWRRHTTACRFSCAGCMAVVRVREQFYKLVTDVEVPGAVVVRRLQALREAQENGRIAAELELLRESKLHRTLLRVPELFALARASFRGRARLAVNVRFERNDARPILERHDGELTTEKSYLTGPGPERWTCTPMRASGAWALPAGWALPIADAESTWIVLRPHVAMKADEEPRPLPSGIAFLLAPLDLLAPEDAV